MKRSLTYALSISLALNLLTGCAPQPKAAKVITIDNTLPIVSLNGSLSDITSTAFEWKPVQDPRVIGYNIYRSTPGSNDAKLARIATVDSRFATHYVDHDLIPNTEYQYRFSTLSKESTESEGSEVLSAITLPMIAPVSFFQSVGNMPRSAKLLWRPHPNIRINGYIIDRLNVNDQQWNKIATLTGRLNAEFIDKDLKDGQVYYYRVRAVTFDNLITEPSETAKVVTKPLPPEITNITSTKDLPKAISLTWDASTIPDLSHYNIYRSSTSNGFFAYHVKLETTQYTDTTKEDGEHFFYKVTVVDKDGLESLVNNVPIQGSSLVKPKTPGAFDGKISANGVDLMWTGTDPRIISYTVIKTTKKTWVSRETVEINNITEGKFHDSSIVANTPYTYQVYGVDKDGIKSLPTQGIELIYETK